MYNHKNMQFMQFSFQMRFSIINVTKKKKTHIESEKKNDKEKHAHINISQIVFILE